MTKTYIKITCLLGLALALVNCANRGTPAGGEKDTEPPKITKATPENYSTNFSGDEVYIYFDEYVKIKNLSKQLIISPPMNTPPEITPLGSASKYIKIKIYDTLSPNTTYAFNFGNSIVDNNEENPFTYYRYVLSTGDYIDSLKVKGTVSDALLRKADDFISVGLYEVDSTYTDSIVYKKAPRYLTNTLDSTTNFTIENIKAGRYKLVALKDENSDNKFQQKRDKIGFVEEEITVPTDDEFSIALFKEFPDYKAIRPSLIAGEHLLFGYEGDYKNTKIELLTKTPKKFESAIIKDIKTDTLHYFYAPKFETDTLKFKITNLKTIDTFLVRITDQKQDSLKLKQITSATIGLLEDFKLHANLPFKGINKKKIALIDKDSIAVPFKVALDTLNNIYNLAFDKTESNRYTFTMFPEAIKGFFETTNDTITYKLNTKEELQYGAIRVKLENTTYPVIVQLTDEKGEIKHEQYATKAEFIDFRFLDSGKYYLRVINDANKNKIYDSGLFLKQRQPERVSHYPEVIELNSGFDMNITFTLK